MGNSSSNENSNVCTGKNAPGLNQYCYTTGHDHASSSSSPDILGDALSALPCTTNTNANKCYAKGFKDAHDHASGNSSSIQSTTNTNVYKGYKDMHTYARITKHSGTLPNGYVYNSGNLIATKTHMVRRPGPRP